MLSSDCRCLKIKPQNRRLTATLQHCWFDAKAVSLKAGTARQSSNVVTRRTLGCNKPERMKLIEFASLEGQNKTINFICRKFDIDLWKRIL
jgi:hypothetical protein